MSLWHELQRRRVFRVAVVYAVTAWIIVQIVTAIAEPLSLPDWVDTFIIVVLGVGFPVALILSWAFDVTPGGIAPASDRPTDQAAIRAAVPSTHWLSHLGQLLILLAVAYLVADQFVLGDAPPAASATSVPDVRPMQRVSILLPAEHTAAFGWRPGHTLAISPDGRTIAYTASAWSDQSQIHHLAVRPIDSLDVREIPGSTDGGFQPFFSPDGRWVAFFTQNGRLMKAPLAGGTAIEVADGIAGGVWAAGVWTDANEIVVRQQGGELLRVSADGGALEPFAGENLSGGWVGRPDYVPAADAVIALNGSNLVAVEMETGVRRVVLEDVDAARFVATGHLVVQRGTALLLIPIDPVTLEIRGDGVPLTDSIRGDGISGERGPLQFDVADNGDIVYARAAEARSQLYAVARDGTAELLPLAADLYYTISVSPDGRTIAAGVDDPVGKVMLLDVERGTARGLPLANPTDFVPQWRPDGEALVTVSGSTEGGGGIFEHVLGGESKWLWRGGGVRFFSWLPDQSALLTMRRTGVNWDIMMMPLDGTEPELEPLIATPANEIAPSVSPDGKWLAYVSDEAGQSQLYLRRFPDGVDLPVSQDFAQGPVWARDSSELYFQGTHEGVLRMMAVKVTDTPSGPPDLAALEPLFPLRTVSGLTRIDAYRVSTDLGTTFGLLADGRFVLPRAEDQTRLRELVLVQNPVLPVPETAAD